MDEGLVQRNEIRERRRLLTTAEAAAYCGSCKSTFDKLRVYGRSPVFLKVGRSVRYDQRDLDDWLQSRRRRSTSETEAA